jgi:hypothetical protein
MKGDVKGTIPVSGEWVAVYAREGKLGRRPVRASDFGTEPVLFWVWTEHTIAERGKPETAQEIAEFVGIVSLGPNLITADDPYLLGYARKGENLVRKFGRVLKTFKAEERAGGYPEARRESLAEVLREMPRTFPCPDCVKGFDSEGGECATCGGAGTLPSGDDASAAIEVVDKTEQPN